MLPGGVRSIPGLGLTDCMRTPRPPNKIKKTIDPLIRHLRLNGYFKYHPLEEEQEDGSSYIPGLYCTP